MLQRQVESCRSQQGTVETRSGRVCGQGDQLKAFTELHVRDDGGLGQE